MSDVRIVSWNCSGAFRTKVDRILDLEADVYVIQEAEPVAKYSALLPTGSAIRYEVRPEYPKGILVFTREGFGLRAHRGEPVAAGHVLPLSVVAPSGFEFDLWAVWTLDASPHEAAYIGQAHLALDELEATLRPCTVMIGDYNSNAVWDPERKRNHSVLVERLASHGLSSAYHQWTGEAQGAETQPTFFLQRNASKPFHIDHCFTDLPVRGVDIGTYADWSGLKVSGGVSDHVPLLFTLEVPEPPCIDEGPAVASVINPEQRYVPTGWDGRIVADCRRHLYDCTHFYEKVDRLAFTEADLAERLAQDPNNKVSFVREASPEEMRSTKPCQTCGTVTDVSTLVGTCPRCFMALPSIGSCDC